MIDVISNTTQKAKKEYYDDAWDFIQEWISGGCWVHGERNNSPRKHITFTEGRFLAKVRRGEIKGSKILVGQEYVRQFNKYEGDTYTWRTKKEFYDLASKYDLFPEI